MYLWTVSFILGKNEKLSVQTQLLENGKDHLPDITTLLITGGQRSS